MSKSTFALLLICLGHLFWFSTSVIAQDRDVLSQLKRELTIVSSDSQKVLLLLEISDNYFTYDNAACIRYAKQALVLSQSIGYVEGEAASYAQMGWGYLNQDRYEPSQANSLKAIEIYEGLDEPEKLARAYTCMGHKFLGEGNYAQATDYYFKTIKVFDNEGDSIRRDYNYVNVALVNSAMGRYEDALRYYATVRRRAKIEDNDRYMVYTGLNIGVAHLELNQYDEARTYFDQALKDAIKTDDRHSRAGTLAQLGILHRRTGKQERALSYMEQALDIARNTGYKQIELLTLREMGEIYLEKNRFGAANKNIIQSIEISESIGSLDNLSLGYKSLSKLNEAQGNYRSAFDNHLKHIQYKDSTFSVQGNKEIDAIRVGYENDKRNALADRKLQRQKLIRNLFMAGFGLVLIFASIFFVQRNRINKTKKLNNELLLNILPKEIAEELMENGKAKTKMFDEVTVMFTDVRNFSGISKSLSPSELVEELDNCFKKFDFIVAKYGIEKIKTIGDSYMCAGGLPTSNQTHPSDVVKAAIEINEFLEQSQNEECKSPDIFKMRIGIHTGPVVAGIVGVRKFAYDIWGDTVNYASRIESSGVIGKINISGSTFERIKNDFDCTYRGKIQAKGQGDLDMYFVEGIKNDSNQVIEAEPIDKVSA